jgi:transposase-like protein
MLAASVFTLGLGSLSGLRAEDSKAQIEALTKTYPLQTCVVSGEKLGEMGAPYDLIYKETVNGKETDRLVRFCCKGCVKDFNKEPAKYITKLNDAVAKKS